ncbi:MAG: streptomycin biosynthesis regulator, partial [Blastocatellia bacterium]
MTKDTESNGGTSVIEVQIKQIRLDGGTQARAELRPEVVDEYCSQMQEGVVFPPVILYYDGKWYWLADGFYRTNGAQKAGKSTILSEVRQGTQRDALRYSLGANSTHG